MLRARQKKKVASRIKELEKDENKLEEQIDTINLEIGAQKAEVYAKQGDAAALVDSNIQAKKEQIAKSLAKKFGNFKDELNQTEKDDIESHAIQLEIEKQKELTAIEYKIDEELNTSEKTKDLVQQQEEIKKRLAEGTMDPAEKTALMEQLAKLDRDLQRQREEDGKNQDRDLEAKKARRKALMAIKRMKIEAKQIDAKNAKEIEINQRKFDDQIDAMTEHQKKQLAAQVRGQLAENGGREQALIMIDQAHNDLLDQKQKILKSKQFFDLSKNLNALQDQMNREFLIRKKEIDFKYEGEKDELINQGVSEQELEEKMKGAKAKKAIDDENNQKQMEEDSKVKESELRQKVEQHFCEEKKKLQGTGAQLKRQDLLEAMDRCKDDPTVQSVGNAMIQRIDNTLEEEMLALEKDKDAAVEKAKLQMIAENDKELAEIQANLDARMAQEEAKMKDQLESRKNQILGLKR